MLQANEAERVGARRSDDEIRCDKCHEPVDEAKAKDAGDATLCPGCYRDRVVAEVIAGVRCVCCWELKANCGWARVASVGRELPAGAELEPSARYPGDGIGREGPTSHTTDYGRGEP